MALDIVHIGLIEPVYRNLSCIMPGAWFHELLHTDAVSSLNAGDDVKTGQENGEAHTKFKMIKGPPRIRSRAVDAFAISKGSIKGSAQKQKALKPACINGFKAF